MINGVDVMSQVDFYVLPEHGNRDHFACVLAQKVWKQGNNIFINTRSETAATAFDDLLWTFKDISFLPHCLVSDDGAENTPVTIGHQNQLPENLTLMINLDDKIPQHPDKIERILEIVAGNEDARRLARKRYAQYRDLGLTLNNHKIDSSYE